MSVITLPENGNRVEGNPPIGPLIQALLIKRGWTGYRLALVTGIPGPTVYRTLRGQTQPSGRTLLRIVQALSDESL